MCVFFFKQKTAYEMRISDWSSDVCSSDLPRNDVRGAQAEIARLIAQHKVELIAIGNGTASCETDKLVADLIVDLAPPKPIKVVVSEAGASVYSASATAAAEFPNLDVSIRGAGSIARRLQDPLAELGKIEPKAIGDGRYPPDLHHRRSGVVVKRADDRL